MKVYLTMSVSGIVPVVVADEKREAIEQLFERADGLSIDVEAFERVAGVSGIWDEILNSIDFTIDDIELPKIKCNVG